jgi:uncharacterized protein YjiS (DUF1127 family)
VGGAPPARAAPRLRRDLETGAWHARNRELLELNELDLGYRLLIADRRADGLASA